MPANYPADSDVLACLQGAGAVLPAAFAPAGLAAAAINMWERRTGYEPFLCNGNVTTRTYDPPGPNHQRMDGFSLLGGSRVLDLGAGAISVQQVSIGVGVGVNGTVLTLGEEYWPEPKNSTAENRPYERIRFRSPIFGAEASVTVTGQFGYGLTVPDDVFLAIVRLGAALGLEQVMEGMKLQPSQWQEDKVAQTWNLGAAQQGAAQFRDEADQILWGYIRMGWLDEK